MNKIVCRKPPKETISRIFVLYLYVIVRAKNGNKLQLVGDAMCK
jgi:hypothetical protein